MGAEVREMTEPPHFRVSALGAFEQRPGCPAHVETALSPERVAQLCLGECYFPGDQRRHIRRIEVVRIRPDDRASAEGETAASRIDDPWLVLPCQASGDGCRVEFEDPEFGRRGQRSAYYVRAIQEATPAVNGAPLGCTRDAKGLCVETRACPASGPDFDPEDDCLAPVQERAWSSPIWLRTEDEARRPRPGRAFARISPTPWGARPGE